MLWNTGAWNLGNEHLEDRRVRFKLKALASKNSGDFFQHGGIVAGCW